MDHCRGLVGKGPTSTAVAPAAVSDLTVSAGKRYGFEIKYADAPGKTKSMHTALADLGLEHLWVVYPGEKRYDLAHNLTGVPAHEIPALVTALKSGTLWRA